MLRALLSVANIHPCQQKWALHALQLVSNSCNSFQPTSIHQAFHTSSLSSKTGREPGTSSVSPLQSITSNRTSSPLQSLPQLDLPVSKPSTTAPKRNVPKAGRKSVARPISKEPKRSWSWWDEKDEKEEKKRDEEPRYPNCGYVVGRGYDQSTKKMNRHIKLIRHLHYQEAVNQLSVLPHKAAAYILEALEHAKEDAIRKGLNPDILVVYEISVRKVKSLKRLHIIGRGYSSIMRTRRSDLKVWLREDADYQGFRARVMAPIMSIVSRRRPFPFAKVV